VVLATRDYPAMRERARHAAAYLRGLAGSAGTDKSELEEYATFAEWLDDENFVFLGYREYDLHGSGPDRSLQVTPVSGLGILSNAGTSPCKDVGSLPQLSEELPDRATAGPLLIVTKTTSESTVHPPAWMEYIGIKRLEDGEVRGALRFL